MVFLCIYNIYQIYILNKYRPNIKVCYYTYQKWVFKNVFYKKNNRCSKKWKGRKIKKIFIQLKKEILIVNLPDNTEILSITPPVQLSDSTFSIQKALEDSTGSSGLDQIIDQKLNKNSQAKAVIVISDNTRPVPYKG